MSKLLRILLPLTFLVACKGKSSKDKGGSPDPDKTSYSLTLELDESTSPSAELTKLVDDINANRPVSFSAITRMLADKHAVASKRASTADITAFVTKITPPNLSSINGRQAKDAYEKAIGHDLVYNRDKSNVADIILDNKMQCYSGTYLYELVTRQVGAVPFRARNEVVIFEPGHVRPGYFQINPANKILVGVETTQSGPAGDWLAMISAEHKTVNQRCVVDAELYAIVELTQSHIKNKAEVVKEALSQTAKRYGYDVDEVCAKTSGDASASTVALLNQSIFGFGSSSVAEGDEPRAKSNDDGQAYPETPGASTGRMESPRKNRPEGVNEYGQQQGQYPMAIPEQVVTPNYSYNTTVPYGYEIPELIVKMAYSNEYFLLSGPAANAVECLIKGTTESCPVGANIVESISHKLSNRADVITLRNCQSEGNVYGNMDLKCDGLTVYGVSYNSRRYKDLNDHTRLRLNEVRTNRSFKTTKLLTFEQFAALPPAPFAAPSQAPSEDK